MTILSIDLGKMMGISIHNNGFEHKEEYKFSGYNDFYNKVNDLILLWKPSLILIPYPTRFYRVILSQAKLMGIVCMLADKNQIQVIEVQDATCKKAVLGSGKAKKEEIMEFFDEESEHVADSKMFIMWYIKNLEKKS